MKTTYITFGTDHNEPHAHLVGGAKLSEGWVAIEAPTQEMGRAIAFAIFGPKFAFDYEEMKRPELYIAGEILRIQWGKSTPGPRPTDREAAAVEFDSRANAANYDTRFTSRPDAVPMWGDLSEAEQDEVVTQYLEEGWI